MTGSAPYSHIELVVARQIFHDMRGDHADPEREPEAWAASLDYARVECAAYDVDQEERHGGSEGHRPGDYDSSGAYHYTDPKGWRT